MLPRRKNSRGLCTGAAGAGVWYVRDRLQCLRVHLQQILGGGHEEKRIEECQEMAEFFCKVGLPVCWSQMGVDVFCKEQVETILNSCFNKFYAIKNMQCAKEIPIYSKGMQDAEALCKPLLEKYGQNMWLEYHSPEKKE